MQECSDGVGREVGAVEGSVWKTAEGGGKRIGGDGASFAQCDVAQLFRQKRSASDRRGAAAAKEARFDDTARFETREELQNISTDWIGHFHNSRGSGQFSRIARIAKVIENSFAEHPRQYRNGMRMMQIE